MNKRMNYIALPNSMVWCHEKEETSLIKGMNDKFIAILSYINCTLNRFDECYFSLEELIIGCNKKPRTGKGRTNEQFKEALIQLVNIGFLKDIDNKIKNCKTDSLIKCKLNLNVENQFFILDYSKVKQIMEIECSNNISLLNTYCYILARLRKREGSTDLVQSGGHAICMYEKQSTMAENLDISVSKLNEFLNLLIANKMIFKGNIGQVKEPNGLVHDANNVFVIDEDELEQALMESVYHYKKKGCKVLDKKINKADRIEYGYNGKIKVEKAKGKETAYLEELKKRKLNKELKTKSLTRYKNDDLSSKVIRKVNTQMLKAVKYSHGA